MQSDEMRSELVHRFQAWLESADDLDAREDNGPDLFTLLTEMVSLKNEVRIEARQFKKALDDFRDIFNLLHGAHDTLTAELARQKEERERQRQETLRPLLLPLLDLHDRLEAGLRFPVGEGGASSFWRRLCHGKEREQLALMREGQKMTFDRLLQMLTSCQVTPIETMGRLFSPEVMEARGTECHDNADEGIVLQELRKGFIWNGQLLRRAEVIVNKAG